MTSRLLALLLVTTLVLPGCATARMSVPDQMSLQQPVRPADETDVWRRFAAKLPVGSRVRVELADGSSVSGTLMVVEDEALIVKPRTRLPEPARRFPFSTIASIEPQRNGIGPANAILIGVVTGAAAFFGLFILAVTALND
jgi:hypothetical protein